MKLTHLKLKNWCQHKELEQTFNKSVVGILGANGKGKSNVLAAIQFLVTGQLPRKNKTYIRDYGQEGGAKAAEASATFVIHGQPMTIKRRITASSSTREIIYEPAGYTGDRPATKDTECTELIRSVLGADIHALTNAVFLPPGSLEALVNSKESTREQIYSRILNLSFLDARAAALADAATKYRITLSNLEPVLELEEMSLKEHVEALDKHCQVTPVDRTADRAIIEDHIRLMQELESLCSTITAAENETRTRENNLNTILAESEYASKEALSAAISSKKTELENVSQRLSNLRVAEVKWSSYLQAKARVETNVKELETLIEDINNLKSRPELSKKDYYVKLYEDTKNYEEFKQTYDAALAQKKEHSLALAENIKACEEADKRLLTCTEANKAAQATREKIVILNAKLSLASSIHSMPVCPICGNAGNMEFNTVSLTQQKAKLEKEVQLVDTAFSEATDEATKLLAHREVFMQRLDATMAHIMQLQESMPPKPEETYTPEALQSVLSTITEIESSITAFQAKLDTLQKLIATDQAIVGNKPTEVNLEDISNLEIESKNIVTALHGLENSYLTIVKCDEAYKVSRSNLNHLQSKKLCMIQAVNDTGCKVSEIDAEIDVGLIESVRSLRGVVDEEIAKSYAWSAEKTMLEDLVTKSKDKINDLKDRIAEEEKRKRLVDMLTNCRSALLKTGVPAAYTKAIFGSISVMVNKILADMQANFSVEVDPERTASFLFRRVDGMSDAAMPQEMLSSGQAVRLAIALLIATQQLILPDVGFLVLDEPSCHIDQTGVENMCELFSSLSSTLGNAEAQVIVVDHHETLARSFDELMQL